MKKAILLVALVVVAGCKSKGHIDNQVAAGEWKIEVQTPPCDSAKNIQVIYPRESGSPITIECNLMPVPEN
jgi:hypothetical protein